MEAAAGGAPAMAAVRLITLLIEMLTFTSLSIVKASAAAPAMLNVAQSVANGCVLKSFV